MKVNEIFFSIQGESSYQGYPCIFIRFSGCNLMCSYCDTNHKEYVELTTKEILKKIKKYNCKLVELTGGEPLFQEEIYELISALENKGYKILVETNGSLSIKKLNNVIKILDIKCPCSNMSEFMDWGNINYLTKNDEVKFVICEKQDYNWAKNVIKKYDLLNKVNTILFSPAFGILSPKKLSNWILQDALPVKLQLQIHKYIGIK